MNFNVEPEDEINQDYSVMDADDPPDDVTPAKFLHTLAVVNQPTLPGSKYATRTSIPNTGLNASPRQSRKTWHPQCYVNDDEEDGDPFWLHKCLPTSHLICERVLTGLGLDAKRSWRVSISMRRPTMTMLQKKKSCWTQTPMVDR